jgi:hypothetical protein
VATSFSQNALLQKPGPADRNWHLPLNANVDLLDGVAAIGQLVVTPTEVPSATLNVRVTSGTYVKGDGTVGSFLGVASLALPASSTVYLWFTDAGTLSTSQAFPTTAHVRLAQVVTGPASVQSVVDQRVCTRTAGTGLGFVLKTGDTLSGPLSVVSPTGAGASLVVDPVGRAIGFFGVTPATQAAAIAPLVDSTNGTAANTIVDVGPT